MRTVSFVDNIEFEYQGNIFSKAVTVGDVDNDKNNELVVGNLLGEIYIFKGRDKNPWAKSSDLGTITCIQIGDICNQGMNFLVVLTSEGWCHVFAIHHEYIPQDEGVSSEERKPIYLKPTHKQHLIANSKALLLADINGDGLNELVIGYTDRQVRMYRWREAAELLSPVPGVLCGHFELMDTWHLAGQLGSVTSNKRPDGTTELMVSQPGGTFVTLHSDNTGRPRHNNGGQESTSGKSPHNSGQSRHNSGKSQSDAEKGKQVEQSQSATQLSQNSTQDDAELEKERENAERSFRARSPPPSGPTLVFHPLGSVRARNIGVTTEIIASISHKKRGSETEVPYYSAICTLDGTLTLVDDDKILWSIYVDHQLFCLTKLDITRDGKEEVIACSWDGHTYLVNLHKQVVRFKFRENVAAFCAGYYAVEQNVNVPCLIFFTFTNRIVVYYNLNMLEIATTTLVDAMETAPGLDDLLQHFSCDASNRSQIQQLYHWCLYGNHPKVT